MNSTTRTKMIDIAKLAGVSIATVDRVLNGRTKVRALTSERVWDAIEQLKKAPMVSDDNLSLDGHIDFILPLGAGSSIEENLRTAIARLGVEQKIDTRCHFFERINPQALSKTMRAMATVGCRGVVIHSLEHPLVRQAVDFLKSEGVACVSLLSEISSAASIGYAGIDNRSAGRTAGYFMSRFLTQQKAKVAILCGSSLYRNHEEREMGFRSVIRESSPNLEVLDLVISGDQAESNFAEVSRLLQKHPDLKGIYSVGSGNRGVVQALIKKNRSLDVTVIAHNLTSSSREYLLQGAVDLVIHQDMEKAANRAIDLLLGRKFGSAQQRIPFELIVKESITH